MILLAVSFPSVAISYCDCDGDGYGSSVAGLWCSGGCSRVDRGGDCNDNDTNATFTRKWYLDQDEDGAGVSSRWKRRCTPDYANQYTARSGGDACDSIAGVYKKARWYKDKDGDGVGVEDDYIEVCAPEGDPANDYDAEEGGDFDDNDSSITFHLVPPSATASQGSYHDRIEIHWDRVVGAASYDVWRKRRIAVNAWGPSSIVSTTTDTSYTDTNVYPGRDYAYRISANRTSGDITYNSWAEGWAEGSADLSRPSGFTGNFDADGVSLEWAPVAGARYYRIYLYGEGGKVDEFWEITTSHRDSSSKSWGQRYTYCIRAWDFAINPDDSSSGHEVWSESSCGVVGELTLTQPKNITVSGCCEIVVNWDAVSQASGYEIWRGTKQGVSYASLHDTSSYSGYTDRSAKRDTTYYYYVRAYREDGGKTYYSVASDQQSGKITFSNTVTGVTVSDGAHPDRIVVSWDPVDCAAGYIVSRSEDGGCGDPVSEPADASYTDTDVTVGKDYYYCVKAFQSCGGETFYSGYSSCNSGHAALSKPQNVQASDGMSYAHIKITWEAVDGATVYEIYRPETEDGSYIHADTDGDGIGDANVEADNAGESSVDSPLIWNDTGVVREKTYWYKVKARAGNYYSTLEGQVPDSGYTKQLGMPQNAQASDGTRYYGTEITWDSVEGATWYKVHRSDHELASGESGSEIARIEDASQLSYLDTTGDHATTYWYQVQARCGGLAGPYSMADAGYRVLPAPANVQASDGTAYAHVEITWEPADGATWYNVWRSESENGTYAHVEGANIGADGELVWRDSTAEYGKTYWYKVKSRRGDYHSQQSTADSGRRVLPAPGNVQASDGTIYEHIEITWEPVDGATWYKVYRADSENGPYVEDFDGDGRGDSASSALIWEDTFADYGKIYWYKVKARAGDNHGTMNNQVPDSGHRVLAAPGNVQATDGTNYSHVEITWEPVDGATWYKVYRADSENGPYVEDFDGDGKGDIYVGADGPLVGHDTKADYGKIYWYKVKARAGDDHGTMNNQVPDSGYLGLATPTAVSPTHEEGAPSNSLEVQVVVSLPETAQGITGFGVEWTQAKTWTPSAVAQDVSWTGDTFTATQDGEWWFHIVATDASGNWSEPVHLGPFVIDTKAAMDPTIECPSVATGVLCNASEILISITQAAKDLSGIAGFEVAWNHKETWSPIGVVNRSADWTSETFTATEDGEWWFHLATCDTAGNWTQTVHLGPFLVDVTSPTATVSSSVGSSTDQALISFEVVFDEPVSGRLLASELSVDNGRIRKLVSNRDDTSWYVEVITKLQGDVSLSVRAGAVEDGVGNENLASNVVTVLYDIEPEMPLVSISTSNPSGLYAIPGDKLTLAFTANEKLRAVRVKVTGCPVDVGIGSTRWEAISESIPSTCPSGPIEFQFSAQDLAGNKVSATRTTDGSQVIFAATPPEAPALLGPTDGTVTANRTPILSWTEPSHTAPLEGYEVSLQTTWSDGSTTTSEVWATGLSATLSDQGDEVYTTVWKVRAKDILGRWGSFSEERSLIVDPAAPTVTLEQAVGQADPTNTSLVVFMAIFSEPVTGFESGDVALGGTANPTVATVTEIAPHDGTTHEIAVSGMTADGTVTASIPADATQDTAGNGNATSSSTDNEVTLDTTPPEVSGVSASDLVITDTDVDTPFKVTLDFSEPMMTSTFGTPDIGFLSEDVLISENFAFEADTWLDDDTYEATYNVLDLDVTYANVDVGGGAARDLAGNVQAGFTVFGVFEIDTEKPTLDPVTLARSDGHEYLSVNNTFCSSAVLQFTSSEPLDGTPVVTIGGHAVSPTSVDALEWSAQVNLTTEDPEGPVPFSITAEDSSENSVTISVPTVGGLPIFDKTPPDAPTALLPIDSSSINDSTPVFGCDSSTDHGPSGMQYYRVNINGPSGPLPLPMWIYDPQTTMEYPYSDLPDGAYTYEIAAVDKGFNFSAYVAGSFTIDTDNPAGVFELTGAAVADGVLSDADAGETVTLVGTFDEDMDQSGPPVWWFDPDVEASGTLVPDGSGSWVSPTRFEREYTIADVGETALDVDILATSASDLAGNWMLPDPTVTTDSFSVDMENPQATVTTNRTKNYPGGAPIYEFWLEMAVSVAYDEPMDTDFQPTITLENAGSNWGPQVSLGWTGDTLYQATFTHNGTEEELEDGFARVSNGSGAVDLAWNPDLGDDSDSFDIDTRKPQVSSITPSLSLITEADDGTTFTLTIDYNEAMVSSVDPTVTFDPEPTTTLSFDEEASGWSDEDTYVAAYTVADVEDEVVGIDVTASGAFDAASTRQDSTTESDVFDIDTDNPSGIFELTGDAMADGVLDSADAGATVTLVATFDEPMDQSGPPVWWFGPNVVGSGTLVKEGNPPWASPTRFEQDYTVADVDETVLSVDIYATSARDLAGNWMEPDPTVTADAFSVDTENPAITSLVWITNDSIVSDVDVENPNRGGLYISFSEPMLTDGSSDPILAFSPNVDTTLPPDNAFTPWHSDTAYGWYTHELDANVDVDSVEVDVSGARDAAGNEMIDYTPEQEFEIDTKNPTVMVNQAEGQNDPSFGSPILFTAVFSEPVTDFETGDVTLGGTAGATTAVVTEVAPNDGTTYEIAVSGMSSVGTVTTTILAFAAQDMAGNSSTASTSTDNEVTREALGTPQNVQASDGSCPIEISWSSVTGATGYAVYRADVCGVSVGESIVYTEDTTYTDTDIALKNHYYYRIHAYYQHEGGSKTFASSYSECSEGYADLAPPQNVQASDGSCPIEISWSSVTGATGYAIYRADVCDVSVGESIVYTEDTSYTDTDVAFGNHYYYRIHAYYQREGRSRTFASSYSECSEGYAGLAPP